MKTCLAISLSLLVGVPVAMGQRSRGFRPPSGVKLMKNLPYAGTDKPRQMLDLLLPEKQADKRPVVIFIHDDLVLRLLEKHLLDKKHAFEDKTLKAEPR